MVTGMGQHNSGYTLLEILVVLVIISIVAGMAILTIGHNDNKEMQSLAKALAQSLTLAEEQALLQPATLGLVLTKRSFCFYEYRQTSSRPSWEPINDRELGLHKLPSNLEMSLQIADKTLPLEQESLKQATPALLISSNGTLTPFRILIGKKGKPPRYALIGQADGSITIHEYSD